MPSPAWPRLQQVTLSTVAPGIAEALVATAIGLFAAIPAVVAYNRFAREIDKIAIALETFIEEFSNILQRNLSAHVNPASVTPATAAEAEQHAMPAMSSRGRGRRTINEINMVPFIDVMLVLLIIFMVTAPLITPSVINLPSVDRANKQPDKPIEIVIKSDDEVQIKKDPSHRQRRQLDPDDADRLGRQDRAGRRRPSARWSSAPTSRSSTRPWSRR